MGFRVFGLRASLRVCIKVGAHIRAYKKFRVWSLQRVALPKVPDPPQNPKPSTLFPKAWVPWELPMPLGFRTSCAEMLAEVLEEAKFRV